MIEIIKHFISVLADVKEPLIQ